MKDNFTHQPKRLLIAPPPFPDENLLGYLIRLTDANGYESLNIIYQAIVGQKFAPLLPLKYYDFLDSEHFEAFCLITGLQAAVIQQIEERRVLINQRANFQFLKFCAECLKEMPYYHLVWDNRFYCACHKHKTILVDICPACKHPFRWGSNKLAICLCGYDIRTTPSTAACPEADIISQRILELCDLSDGSDNPVFKNKLGALKLAEFCKVLSLMAALRTEFLGVDELFKETDNFKRHELISGAYKLLEFWPQAFEGFIYNLTETAPLRLLSTWSRYRDSDDPSLELVLKEWRRIIQKTWPEENYDENQPQIIDTYSLDANEGMRFNNGEPLDNNIHVSEDWILQKLSENGVGIPYFQSTKNLFQINAIALKKFLKEFVLPYSIWKISRQYQIPEYLVLKLATSGLFEIACHVEVKSRLEPRLNIIPIAALFSAIRNYVQNNALSDKAESVTLSEAIELINRYFLCPIRFIDDLRRGYIRPIEEVRQPNVQRNLFYFSLTDLSAYAKSLGCDVIFKKEIKAPLHSFQAPFNSDHPQERLSNGEAAVSQTWFQRAARLLDERQKVYRVPHNLDFQMFMQAAVRILGVDRTKISPSEMPYNSKLYKGGEDEFLQADFEQIFLDSMDVKNKEQAQMDQFLM
ncbi:MAG: TniQ family protein [Blastocatellia bacterium]